MLESTNSTSEYEKWKTMHKAVVMSEHAHITFYTKNTFLKGFMGDKHTPTNPLLLAFTQTEIND